ncbi:DUF4238 domain-containing protein [Streptomyces fulvoviolaceus]|uniref:DUF4238 domain-containing protein n=1 Tax=Streptomyces fulvoviolaceus TaxID=285535 RepID=UPI0004C50C68|nr:DUF4238 domain-containing protein [Streptomyces fulvoviolaceus]
MPDHPKKHHFVPQLLLRRFADPAERLIVHRVMAQKQYQASVTNVGHRNFGHTLYRPGRAPDHTTLEAAMSQIEGDAMAAIRTLDAARSRALRGDACEALAWLLALQWQRSRFLMYVVAREVDTESQGQQASQEEMQTSLLGLLDSYVISPWTMRHEDVCPKERWNYLVSLLASMHWSCYRPRAGGLLVGDNVVCFSGYVGSDPPSLPPGVYDHGVGAGLHECKRITVPLGDSLALLICRDPDEARRLDTAVLNRFTVFNSREFVAHSPGWAAAHPRLAHELSTWPEIQHMIAPAFLQDYGISGVM